MTERDELRQIVEEVVALGRDEYLQAVAAGSVRNDWMGVFRPREAPGSYGIESELRPEAGHWAADRLEDGESEASDALRVKLSRLHELIPEHFQKLRSVDSQTLGTSALHGAVKEQLLGGQSPAKEVTDAIVDFVVHQRLTMCAVIGVRGLALDAPMDVCGFRLFEPTTAQRTALLGRSWGYGEDARVYECDVLATATIRCHWRNVYDTTHLADVEAFGRLLRATLHHDVDIRGPAVASIGVARALFAGIAIEGASKSNQRYGRMRGARALALTQGHLSFMDEVWPVFQSSPQNVALAMDRLERAAARSDAVDRLVDLSVCLEALLTAGGEQGEISYRLRMRGARVLSPPEERPSTKKFLRDAYSARSKAVHGASVENIDALVEKFGEFARRVVAAGALSQIRYGSANLSEHCDDALLGDPSWSQKIDELQSNPVITSSGDENLE